MALKSIATQRMDASKPVRVYHDILHFIAVVSNEIEQFTRRASIEITNQLDMKAMTAPVSKDSKICCHVDSCPLGCDSIHGNLGLFPALNSLAVGVDPNITLFNRSQIEIEAKCNGLEV